MLIVVIAAFNYEEVKKQINLALKYEIDAIELRLDYLAKLDLAELVKLRQSIVSVPVIFTLRKLAHGGKYDKSEKMRLDFIEKLLCLEPDFFDLEYDVPDKFITRISQKYQRTKLICSYHNFRETPENLLEIFFSIKRNEFSLYKIATYANSTLDALRMLYFVKLYNNRNISGMCMGELGEVTRVLSPTVSGNLTYASLDDVEKVVEGQISVRDLLEIYHYRNIDCATQIYALIGNPVTYSQGHVFHNRIFHIMHKNAVYVKLKLNEHELQYFMHYAKHLNFKGLSVTMPLKEKIGTYLTDFDEGAANIQAVNTVVMASDKLVGYNTDGIGAVGGIEKYVKIQKSRMVVIGAGGTAKAIVYESVKKGANVVVFDRTLSRALDLAKQFNCLGYDLNDIKVLSREGYDILVNATSLGMQGQIQASPVSKEDIISNSIILDVVSRPKETKFIKLAKTKNCICITGEDVFVNQALEQDKIWFGTKNLVME